jgi:peroxiredoxin Q/BCP
MLHVGEKAPGFALQSASGEIVRLSDFLGKNIIVLYFYPKDQSPVCTIEACTFRDSYEVFRENGAEVIGISPDSPESHRLFIKARHLPFILLSDPDNEVRKRYGIAATMGIIPGRVTFIIDRKGIIRDVFSSQFRGKKHVAEALKTLERLKRENENLVKPALKKF